MHRNYIVDVPQPQSPRASKALKQSFTIVKLFRTI